MNNNFVILDIPCIVNKNMDRSHRCILQIDENASLNMTYLFSETASFASIPLVKPFLEDELYDCEINHVTG